MNRYEHDAIAIALDNSAAFIECVFWRMFDDPYLVWC